MNRQPFQLKAPFYDSKISPFWMRVAGPAVRRKQIKHHRLLEVEVRGLEHLRSVVNEQAGVLLTPNHPGHADAFVMFEVSKQLGRPFHFMAAWQVFDKASRLVRWLYQRHGCFSIEREGADLRAFKRAVQILSIEPHPLVIFPEGEVYHLNDRLTPFYDGPAAIALTATKHATRPIYVVPCGMKYQYLQDPTSELEATISDLERSIHWRPRTGQPLAERVYRFAEAAVALKELEYIGRTQLGTLPERLRGLMDYVLGGLEQHYGLKPRDQSVPERIKAVRRSCLEKLQAEDVQPSTIEVCQRNLEDTFFVVQLFSYPGDYVAEQPTIERIAETIDKFEEDVLGAATATIRGARRALVTLGAPIDVRRFADGSPQPRKAAAPLTDSLEQAVQSLINGMNG
jgi:1-acyl-sn-glycerol-3-phosphate acyltransferase